LSNIDWQTTTARMQNILQAHSTGVKTMFDEKIRKVSHTQKSLNIGP